MALFALTCTDKPGALELRIATRPAHFAYLQGLPGVVRMAGPLLGADGEMCGSLLIVDAEDLAGAQAFSAADPYTLAGLFERVDIRGWRLTIGQIAGGQIAGGQIAGGEVA
jgi:uncharacterized protein YciI